jgi:hypothetical protein
VNRGLAGRWAREWVRGERQGRLKTGRRWFSQEWDLGHQRWSPLKKKKKVLFPRVGAVNPGLGACSPLLPPPLPWGWGEHVWFWWPFRPLPPRLQCLKPPWPFHWWWSCCGFVCPPSASSGTGSLPGGGCWAEATDLCRGPECAHVQVRVLQPHFTL